MLAHLVLGIIGYILLVHPLVVYLIDKQGLRKFPTPGFAGISSLWRVSFIARHVHFRAIYDAHRRLGTHVRIGPNHLSVSDPQAMNDIYGHGANFLKSDFYDVGAGKHRSITDTRSKEEHQRKRKNLAHAFAQKTITGMEPVVRPLLVSLVERLDTYTKQSPSLSSSSSPSSQSHKANLRTHLYHFAIDFMSIVIFGRPLDLVSSGTDIVPAFLQETNGRGNTNTEVKEKASRLPSYPIHFLSTLHNMAQKDAIIAVEPQLQSYTSRLLAFHPGTPATRRWGDMMTYLVRRRRNEEEHAEEGLGDEYHSTEAQQTKNDIFSKLLRRNGQGKPLNPEEGELIADCSIMFSAGSDGNANVLISAAYLIFKHPEVLEKLRKELDEVLGGQKMAGKGDGKIENLIPYYHQVASLSYLRACIDESMRLRPPVTIGFPRVVPEGGRMVAGRFVEAGVVISVPTYTLHQDPVAFENPTEYNPDRWMQLDQKTPEEKKRMSASFQPFSYGPRACIGRNISYFEQILAVATIVSLFDFDLAENQTLDTIERLNGNPGDFFVGVRRREGVW